MLNSKWIKLLPVTVVICVLVGLIAGGAVLNSAGAEANYLDFIENNVTELTNSQVRVAFSLAGKVIETDGALTQAQEKTLLDNGVTKSEALNALNMLESRLTDDMLESIRNYDADYIGLIEGIDLKVLKASIELAMQLYDPFKKVPLSGLDAIFGEDMAAARSAAEKGDLEWGPLEKMLQALSSSEKASFKEVLVATGAYAPDSNEEPPQGGGAGGGVITPPSTGPEELTKDEVVRQIAENAVQIVASVKESVEIMPDASAELIKAGKGIMINREDGAAGVAIPAGAFALQDGASLKVGVQAVDADKASGYAIALPQGVKTAGLVFDITVSQVQSGSENKLVLKKPVTITLSYAGAAIDSSEEEKLGAYWYDQANNKWEYMGGKVDRVTKTISFQVSHLSEYALLVWSVSFADVSSHWARTDIETMAARHVVQGGPDGLFHPDDNITRAEFAAMLVRLLGIDQGQAGDLKFNDVGKDQWYYNSVAAAYAAGIIQGYDENTFGSDDRITREQLAAMVTRAYVYSGGLQLDSAAAASKLALFADRGDISSWAALAVATAVDKKIINGYPGGAFKPVAPATRAEALVMLKRLCL